MPQQQTRRQRARPTLSRIAQRIIAVLVACGAVAAAGTSRDLSIDDARGGHTLKRHVGRTDAQLAERLAREHVSAASTYPDRATAERVVGR